MSDYAVRPNDGWQTGDSAYCVRGCCLTSPTLERGKVYEIAAVKRFTNMVDSGLKLVGVSPPDGYEGVSSGRFVKLRRGQSAMRQIESATRRRWTEAYYASTGRAAPDTGAIQYTQESRDD